VKVRAGGAGDRLQLPLTIAERKDCVSAAGTVEQVEQKGARSGFRGCREQFGTGEEAEMQTGGG